MIRAAGTAAAVALVAAACGSAPTAGHGSVPYYTQSDNPCVNSRVANGTWQQDGYPRTLALDDAETYCSYGAAFDYVSDPATGMGPNTSGWSYPGRCSQMPACLNQ